MLHVSACAPIDPAPHFIAPPKCVPDRDLSLLWTAQSRSRQYGYCQTAVRATYDLATMLHLLAVDASNYLQQQELWRCIFYFCLQLEGVRASLTRLVMATIAALSCINSVQPSLRLTLLSRGPFLSGKQALCLPGPHSTLRHSFRLPGIGHKSSLMSGEAKTGQPCSAGSPPTGECDVYPACTCACRHKTVHTQPLGCHL